MQSAYNQHAISMQSACNQHAITGTRPSPVHSPDEGGNQLAISMQSLARVATVSRALTRRRPVRTFPTRVEAEESSHRRRRLAFAPTRAVHLMRDVIRGTQEA